MILNFKNKAEYLVWREEWKKAYKALSSDIRDMKQCRKKYVWKYRAKDDTESKRRTKVGDNSKYDPSVSWKLVMRGDAAHQMMCILDEAKLQAAKQREEQKLNELMAI